MCASRASRHGCRCRTEHYVSPEGAVIFDHRKMRG